MTSTSGQFRNRKFEVVDPDTTYPLTLAEQQLMAELTVELSSSCYAGTLMLQAMGLGGWMFDGLDSFAVLGASGNPNIAGLGFRFDTSERWPYPNPTGLQGIMEGYCPPHYPNMRSAVEAVTRRNSTGQMFRPDTLDPGKNRKSAFGGPNA
jgi:hypothetical protein